MTAVRLNLLVIETRQPDRLKDFYQALGVDATAERHGDGPTHYAGRVGDVVLELYPLPGGAGTADATTRLGFAVDDLDATLRSLESAGAAVVTSPRQTRWGYCAVVRDPDGRAVELYQN